ncbi:MAG TPA: energy transducer TonB [Verrucomicrobiae bacterium]|nr:energy transducer TonB [Verrucomicrobiae bacterium]
MADLSQPNTPFANTPDDHLARLLVDDVEAPWYKSFVQNIKDAINPPKLPPLQVTSKPVPVKDIWGLYGRKKKSWLMSTGFQVTAVALVLALTAVKPVQEKMKEAVSLVMPVDLAPPDLPVKKQVMQGGGGGGDRSPLPAAKGRLPKFALKQFTPPMQVVQNMNPKLSMDPTLIGPPDLKLPNVNMDQYGDPLAKIGPPSNGPGSGGGIGSGSGGGIGSGKGGGFGPGEGGGVGGGVYRVGGGVTAPTLLSKVEPEYSEEARKAKYQGTVTLYIQVDPTGKAINMRVLHSLGLGLDEKAMEAVKKWRFRPGTKDGKPVTVEAQIEVNFRLL